MREAAGEALGALIGGSIQNKLIEQQDESDMAWKRPVKPPHSVSQLTLKTMFEIPCSC